MKKQTKTLSRETMVSHKEALRFEILVQRNLPQLQRINTFAKMLKMTPNISKIIENIHLLLPPICYRKDQASLSDNEKQRYICAFNMITAFLCCCLKKHCITITPMYVSPIGIGPNLKNSISLIGL